MTEPAVKLYDFQKRWLADKSRFKIANICRQSGKSFIVSLEAIIDAVETGDNWVLLSAGERQSKELMEKCKMHAEAMKAAAGDIKEDFFADTQCKQLTIQLSNGARLIGLPANPDTARGFSANVILDEFAFHRDSEKIWKALFPTVSRGYKLRVVSTPQGKSNRFYTLFTGENNNFSKQFVDIYQAVKDGVPHDIDMLKAAIDDDDAWSQEFECRFMDEATAFLTYDLISGCESDDLKCEYDYESFNLSCLDGKTSGALYAGVDIGRKKDLTVIWIAEQLGDVFATKAIITLDKVPFSKQESFLHGLIGKLKISRTCIDATGIGAQLAENTTNRFGLAAEEVPFNNKVKNDLATRTLRIFQDIRCRIPVSQKLRNDLHSIKKTTTIAGNIRFDAQRTKDGHADRFWAMSLAFMASDEGNIKPECIWL